MRLALKIIAVCLLGIISFSVIADKHPWQRRVGKHVAVCHKLAHQRVLPEMWPPEPGYPNKPDPEKFKAALGQLCGRMPPVRLERFSKLILEESAVFEVDPFLLSALISDQSGCRPKTPENATGYGLTRINLQMHAPHFRSGEYRYFLKDSAGTWQQHSLPTKKYPFNQWKAAKSASNIYLSAAILKVLSLQCPDLDAHFGGVPHRHYIAHWFYGDKVKESEPADRILTARRRMLAYYQGHISTQVGEYGGNSLTSPLDGIPRLIIDDFLVKRGVKKDAKLHQGIDLKGVLGEPVRAISDGRVVFAGVDMPGAGSKIMTPNEAATIANRDMGAGGIYVAIKHKNGLRTYYMHLDSLVANDRQEVVAGQIIGTLGRSGTVQSGPHLHLEFRTDDGGRVDPAKYLSKGLVDPKRFEAP